MVQAWLVTCTLTPRGVGKINPEKTTFILIGKHPVRYALEDHQVISDTYIAVLDFYAEISMEEALAHLESSNRSAFEVLDYR